MTKSVGLSGSSLKRSFGGGTSTMYILKTSQSGSVPFPTESARLVQWKRAQFATADGAKFESRSCHRSFAFSNKGIVRAQHVSEHGHLCGCLCTGQACRHSYAQCACGIPLCGSNNGNAMEARTFRNCEGTEFRVPQVPSHLSFSLVTREVYVHVSERGRPSG